MDFISRKILFPAIRFCFLPRDSVSWRGFCFLEDVLGLILFQRIEFGFKFIVLTGKTYMSARSCPTDIGILNQMVIYLKRWLLIYFFLRFFNRAYWTCYLGTHSINCTPWDAGSPKKHETVMATWELLSGIYEGERGPSIKTITWKICMLRIEFYLIL